MIKKLKIYSIILSLVILASCRIGYSFSGGNVSPDIETVSVEYIQNHALLVNPNLSQYLTEEIKNKFVSQTSLELVKEDGDWQFSGDIKVYRTSPAAIQGDMASQTRLTISVFIKFVNTKNSEEDFERNFSGYTDFPSDKSLDEVEDQAVTEIVEKIVNDIFNATAGNW
jgi:hypothetical protein